MYVYICIYTYICNYENNLPSRLSPQRLSGNLCTWTYDVQLLLNQRVISKLNKVAMCNYISCAQGHEFSQRICGDNGEGTLF